MKVRHFKGFGELFFGKIGGEIPLFAKGQGKGSAIGFDGDLFAADLIQIAKAFARKGQGKGALSAIIPKGGAGLTLALKEKGGDPLIGGGEHLPAAKL